jgi:hypothetical protein
VKWIVGGEQPAGNGGDTGAEREGHAVRAVDVDAHIGCRSGIVGGGAQRFSDP